MLSASVFLYKFYCKSAKKSNESPAVAYWSVFDGEKTIKIRDPVAVKIGAIKMKGGRKISDTPL